MINDNIVNGLYDSYKEHAKLELQLSESLSGYDYLEWLIKYHNKRMDILINKDFNFYKSIESTLIQQIIDSIDNLENMFNKNKGGVK